MKMFKHRKSILIFIFISFLIYYVYYVYYKDLDAIFESFFLNLASLPIYVVFTTFILDGLLNIREKPLLIRKRNTTIGIFYSEMGSNLLKELSLANKNTPQICPFLLFSEKWNRQSFTFAKNLAIEIVFDLAHNDLESVLLFLNEKRDFMLTLLQNPILSEDQSFNNLILSVFHLQQELAQRNSDGELTKDDLEHLTIDIKRVYSSLLFEWLNYLEHISVNYPHLYSLEVRINPFKELSEKLSEEQKQ